MYVALPAHAPIPGYFAHLEWDVNQQRPELRLLYDHGDGKLTPGILYLDRATISEALRDVLATTLATAADGQSHDIHTAGDPATEEQWRAQALAAGLPVERIDAALLATRELLEVAISTVLYLCVEEPDILDPDQPPERAAHHPADRTGFAAAAATVWEVGYRYGAAVRARHAPSTTAGAAHNPPRAHIRRAHWHHYWTGPRDGERTLALRWIAPTLVGAQDPEQLIPTIKSPPV